MSSQAEVEAELARLKGASAAAGHRGRPSTAARSSAVEPQKVQAPEEQQP